MCKILEPLHIDNDALTTHTYSRGLELNLTFNQICSTFVLYGAQQ